MKGFLKNLGMDPVAGTSKRSCGNRSTKATGRCSEREKVFYRCTPLGPELLPKSEWDSRIKSYLDDQFVKDKTVGSSLMIHSLNVKEKANQCVGIICIYLNNLILHPDDEKYKRIRTMNKNYRDKVEPTIGANDFLISAGFKFIKDDQCSINDKCLIYDKNIENTHIQYLIDTIQNTRPILAELDRNAQIFSTECPILDFPSDFYNLTVEEVKREQKYKTDRLEAESHFMTKAARERLEKPKPVYVHTFIRIRFPEGLYLQGTFQVVEKLIHVRQFISECIRNGTSFSLRTASGRAMGEDEDQKTLLDLNLVPAVLLNINIIKDECEIETNPTSSKSIFKDELISKIKRI